MDNSPEGKRDHGTMTDHTHHIPKSGAWIAYIRKNWNRHSRPQPKTAELKYTMKFQGDGTGSRFVAGEYLLGETTFGEREGIDHMIIRYTELYMERKPKIGTKSFWTACLKGNGIKVI